VVTFLAHPLVITIFCLIKAGRIYHGLTKSAAWTCTRLCKMMTKEIDPHSIQH